MKSTAPVRRRPCVLQTPHRTVPGSLHAALTRPAARRPFTPRAPAWSKIRLPAAHNLALARCTRLPRKALARQALARRSLPAARTRPRAKELHSEIGSIGAYSHSQGVLFIRKNVAKFISERDGHPADPDDLINMLITDPAAGILIPIPQYPLYTAALAQHHGRGISYMLDESSGWSTSVEAISDALANARAEGTSPKALVVINPGNPTGALLTAETMAALVRLCEEHSLVLLADEVYQNNLHRAAEHPFTSFKKVVRDLRSPVPLVSFHSISKGVSGECGRRGGYLELTNIAPEVRALIYKLVSVGLCPPLSGQIGVDSMVRPPKAGEPSYALWKQETDAIHAALAERTRVMARRLNALPGVSCVESPGALYLFPKIEIPAKAAAAARAAGKEPDAFYALALLDETGICVVPGSGFGQKAGEWHYRLTCLCPGVEDYVGKLERFHLGFIAKHAWRAYVAGGLGSIAESELDPTTVANIGKERCFLHLPGAVGRGNSP
ncbi:alanine aminotransferase [Mycena pura]|uniref:Alanine aminotransferase n=1 Tax=Mycena pura TaxID=153505 RepID=A0AAD6VPH8_9AGAR|nr:alanine aminotransferase [Mycena pura]